MSAACCVAACCVAAGRVVLGCAVRGDLSNGLSLSLCGRSRVCLCCLRSRSRGCFGRGLGCLSWSSVCRRGVRCCFWCAVRSDLGDGFGLSFGGRGRVGLLGPRRRLVSLTGVSLTRVSLTRVSLTRVSLTRVSLGGVGLTGVALRAASLGVRLALRLGLRAALGQRLRHRRRERDLAVRLRLGHAQRALSAGQALELLPVAGDLEDLADWVGRLRADGQPVLCPLRVDLDERRLSLRVVLADLLDRAPVSLGTGVGDDDAVIRRADLAQALQLDLDSHGCGLLPANWCRAGRRLSEDQTCCCPDGAGSAS